MCPASSEAGKQGTRYKGSNFCNEVLKLPFCQLSCNALHNFGVILDSTETHPTHPWAL